MEITALRDSLRKVFLEYRKQRPHLSLRSIAKNSGVNRYFLMKLSEEDDQRASLDLTQVLLFIKFITQKESIHQGIESLDDDIQKYIKKIFYLDQFLDKKISSDFDNFDFSDSYIYFVLVLASFGHGAKEDLVLRVLGEKGEDSLAKLIKSGVVVRRNERIYLAKGNDFTISPEVMWQRIPDYLRYINRDEFGKKRNHFHLMTQGLNRNGLRKVQAVYESMFKEVCKVVKDKNNWGDIPFFSFACMDTLIQNIDSLSDKEHR